MWQSLRRRNLGVVAGLRANGFGAKASSRRGLPERSSAVSVGGKRPRSDIGGGVSGPGVLGSGREVIGYTGV